MPKIIRRGAPNNKTPGVLGQEYLDKNTKKTYICTHVDVEPGDRSGETTATYAWTPEGSGGASSWNDLTDKPFYEEPGKDYILKDLDLAPMEYEGQGVMYFNPVLNIDSIPTGKPILLDFFGKTYVGEDDRSDNNGIRFYGVSFDYPDEYGTRTDARIRLRNNYFSIENGYTADLSFWAGVKVSVYTEGTEVHTLDPKYIKDMYYSEMALKPLIKDYTFTTKTSGNEICKHYIYAGDLNYYPTLVVGDTYTITVDGVDYKVVATKNSGIPENADGAYDFTQCPVYIGQGSSGNVVFITETPGETHTVSFYHDGDMEEVVHTIPEKYLPQPVVITDNGGEYSCSHTFEEVRKLIADGYPQFFRRSYYHDDTMDTIDVCVLANTYGIINNERVYVTSPSDKVVYLYHSDGSITEENYE